jgi:hypothetical chaperone protein
MLPLPMIYAIDFGTTNSLLGAVIDGKEYAPIPLDPKGKDPTILRSVLFFPDRHNCFYGAEAVNEFVKHDMEGRFVRSIKKFLPVRSFASTMIGSRNVSLEEIIATFLGELRRRANAHFGKDVKAVMMGRPAKFAPDAADDQFAQDRLEAAARIAGFEKIKFCPEPVAAAFDFKKEITTSRLLLVADFGGGTSDFTVVRIGREEYQPRDVLAIGGVALAGDALDGAVMRRKISHHFGADVKYRAPFGENVLTMPRHLMEKICSAADISLLRQRDTMEFFRQVQGWSLGENDREHIDNLFHLITEQIGFELFEEIERVKRALSASSEELFDFKHSGIRVTEKITRQDFDSFIADPVERILKSLDQTLIDAGVTAADIDIVCATGGTARVPALRKGLETRFGQAKIQESNRFHSIVSGLIKVAAQGNL